MQDPGQIEKSRPSCALSPAKKHAGKRCRCSLQAGYQASRQDTVLRVCAGRMPGLGSGLAVVPAAVGLSDGQVKHGLLRVSLLTGHEQQGLHLGHPQVRGGRPEVSIGARRADAAAAA